MHSEARLALKQGLQQAFGMLKINANTSTERREVWTKEGPGRWNMETREFPSIRKAFDTARTEIDEAATQFNGVFFTRHAEFSGRISFPGVLSVGFGPHDSTFFQSALWWLWQKRETLNVDEATVDAVVEDVAAFVDEPVARFMYQAQLLNYKMNKEACSLTDQLTIRRLAESEVSALHGGFRSFLRGGHAAVHEFVIECERDERLSLGKDLAPEDRQPDPVRATFDKAVLCLRTFKEGHVGYDYIHSKPITFCPVSLPSVGYGDMYVPFGVYEVTDSEAVELKQYADMLFKVSDLAMEMACSRLADAETRTRPRDRIVDAVIGMEAILLAGLGKDERRGELKYRFSLNYSTLFGSPDERYRSFRVAKSLYDLRSTIAHGSALDERDLRVGPEVLDVGEAAKRATAALRFLIQRFLPQAASTPYRKHDFWERGYFGISP